MTVRTSRCTTARGPSRCWSPTASPAVGQPALLAVEPGGDESRDAWAGFLEDLTDRGLRAPLLVVSDGAAGLIGAIEQKMPAALRQRCLIHRCRNILAKVPAGRRDELKTAFWEIFDPADDICPGEGAVRCAQANIDSFARRYEREFPAAVRCMLTDRAALTAHLRFPAEHRRRIRHTNLIERTFGETRRRVKVIGRLPGEASCLSLVWAVLDRASGGWRGLTYTPAIARRLAGLRHQLHTPAHTHTDQHHRTVTRAAQHDPRNLRPQAAITPNQGRHRSRWCLAARGCGGHRSRRRGRFGCGAGRAGPSRRLGPR